MFLGDDVKQDWTSIYEKFFKNVLSIQYRDPAIAYETIQFVVGNLDTLCHDTNILSRFFPNLFKVRSCEIWVFVYYQLKLCKAFKYIYKKN